MITTEPAETVTLYLSRRGLGSKIQLPAFDRMSLVPVTSVRSLGGILDAFVTMEAQISSVAWLAFYHLWIVKQLVLYLTPCDLAIVTHAIVLPDWITVNSTQGYP